jgi:biopolymer transport protein ExbB
MIPLIGLSVLTVGCALERALFWYKLLSQEKRIVHDVLEAAHHDLLKAASIARKANHSPIGRYLLAPLRLDQPHPETFHLALETASEKEFYAIHRGDKLLESVVGLAPLLGLLGTVTGLIHTFGNLNIGGGGSTADLSKASAGIGEALFATASGMVIAIAALSILRILVTLEGQQLYYFSIVGSDLELIYRHIWHESKFQPSTDLSTPKSLLLDYIK